MLLTAKEELYDINVGNTTIFVGKSDIDWDNTVVIRHKKNVLDKFDYCLIKEIYIWRI